MRFWTVVFLLPYFAATLQAEEVCTYVTNTGKLEQVSSRGKVPSKYLRSAKCTTLKEDVVLAKPEEIDLEGAVRRVSMGSPLGSINMRWPKKIERLFGRTPERALADAARAVSRSLRSGSFPGIVKNMSPRWEVVFLDADLPEEQIPAYLIGACHPGWMTPPANIYIVGQRVAGGCAGGSASTKVADAQLAEVLIHEMGHAVEFELLRGNYSMDLVRAEGFATWFTQYAATYSSEIDVKSLKQRYLDMAQEALRRESNVGHFSGSSLDYARASMIFSAIVDRRGITGLMKVYNIMAAQRLPFFEAIQSGIGWNQRRLQEEVLRLVR